MKVFVPRVRSCFRMVSIWDEGRGSVTWVKDPHGSNLWVRLEDWSCWWGAGVECGPLYCSVNSLKETKMK